jgi:hypothetical protein
MFLLPVQSQREKIDSGFLSFLRSRENIAGETRNSKFDG